MSCVVPRVASAHSRSGGAPRYGGGDMRGQEWPEWTLPDSAWGDDRPCVRASRSSDARNSQPLREKLTDKLAAAGRIRPEHSRFSYTDA
jgi:hypothetical protein